VEFVFKHPLRIWGKRWASRTDRCTST